MRAKTVILSVLLVLLGMVYIAAKIHAFTRYQPYREGPYFREHWIYWAMAAVLALLAWVVQKWFPDKPKSHKNPKP